MPRQPRKPRELDSYSDLEVAVLVHSYPIVVEVREPKGLVHGQYTVKTSLGFTWLTRTCTSSEFERVKKAYGAAWPTT